MIGRLLGLIVGAAIVAVGYGLWKPAEFAKYVPPKYLDLSDLPLGPFAQYKLIIAGVVMVVGIIVALAALQRQGRRKGGRPAVTMFDAPEAPAAESSHIDSFAEPAHGEDDHHPAPAQHH